MARKSAAADAETLVETPSPEHQQIAKADPKLGQALKKENVQVSFLRLGSLEDENAEGSRRYLVPQMEPFISRTAPMIQLHQELGPSGRDTVSSD